MFLKTLLAHMLITIIVFIILSLSDSFSDLEFLLIFLLGLTLYFFSGYFLTNSKTKWYKYFSVAILGIIFWIICFSISPNSTNYKGDSEAGNWFLYQLYISVSSPLNSIDYLNSEESYTIEKQLMFDLLVPIILSFSQFLGGFVSKKRLDVSA